jgi:hypothetical protein
MSDYNSRVERLKKIAKKDKYIKDDLTIGDKGRAKRVADRMIDKGKLPLVEKRASRPDTPLAATPAVKTNIYGMK